MVSGTAGLLSLSRGTFGQDLLDGREVEEQFSANAQTGQAAGQSLFAQPLTGQTQPGRQPMKGE
jgi:hypothetical protein